jgi:ATP-dependent helicase HrpA
VHLLLPSQPSAGQADAVEDIRAQLDRLLPPGFVTSTGRAHLGNLVRYLNAIQRRLDRLPHGVEADRQRMQQVHALEDAYDELVRALPTARQQSTAVRDIAWQIEELRVSLWAQQLGTPRPVSEQRIRRAIDAVASGR